MEYYSHIQGERKEKVADHLALTANYASSYAGEFNYKNLGYILGYFHDTGKMTQKFQGVLSGKNTKINHAMPGAAILFNEFGDLFEDEYTKQVAFGIIKGHHAGLTEKFDEDLIDDVEEEAEGIKADWEYIDDGKENALSSEDEYNNILSALKKINFKKSESVDHVADTHNDEKMLLIRLLLSSLVDGDYTSTYLFDKNISTYESPQRKSWDEMKALLTRYRNDLVSKSDKTLSINKLRNIVYDNAVEAGKNATAKFYSMTAPTGTAKTLALLAFAIECAKKNNQNRIIVLLPYLSIIDQTVAIYNEIFGKDLVLEDDSAAEYKTKETYEASVMRLIADKWDNQIIITTNVKFFESLFSSKPKDLRKLHNMANAVIVYDESQTLPSDLADVSMNTLNALTKYNTTVLFSTATPPDFKMRKGIRNTPEEIIRDTKTLYEEYERTHKLSVEFLKEKISMEALADKAGDSKQALFIFNTTSKAKKMYEMLKAKYESNVYILYTRMCQAHRKQVIKEVKNLLKENKPCHLVSTQCIEAGVDLDFPTVCREYAPFPSIIQSMGRCNRNGIKNGKAIVFELDEANTHGYPDNRYRTESMITKQMAKDAGFNMSLTDLSILGKYYKAIFAGDGPENSDKRNLKEAVSDLNFVETDKEYKIIEDKNQISVIVPYDDKDGTYDKVVAELETNRYTLTKRIMAKTHAITVSIYASSPKAKNTLENCLQLHRTYHGEQIGTNWYVMVNKDGYNNNYGIETEQMKGWLFA